MRFDGAFRGLKAYGSFLVTIHSYGLLNVIKTRILVSTIDKFRSLKVTKLMNRVSSVSLRSVSTRHLKNYLTTIQTLNISSLFPHWRKRVLMSNQHSLRGNL